MTYAGVTLGAHISIYNQGKQVQQIENEINKMYNVINFILI